MIDLYDLAKADRDALTKKPATPPTAPTHDAVTAARRALAAVEQERADLEAEIKAAHKAAADAESLVMRLSGERERGASADAIQQAKDLIAARTTVRASRDLARELEAQRPLVQRRYDAAERKLIEARRGAARPEAERMRRETIEAFEKAFAALHAANSFSREHGFDLEGAAGTFDERGERGDGIRANALNHHGYIVEIRRGPTWKAKNS